MDIMTYNFMGELRLVQENDMVRPKLEVDDVTVLLLKLLVVEPVVLLREVEDVA